MLDNNLITIKTLLRSFKSKASACLAVILFGAFSLPALAQGTPPADTASCTVTAVNRTAPLQGDYSFVLYNMPGNNIGTPPPAPNRTRVVCSDGTVGETDLAFPTDSLVTYTSQIFWRPSTPIPVALNVTAAQNKLNSGQSTQLSAVGILVNGQTADVSTLIKGTRYTSSNPLIANVNQEGLATVTAGFATSSFT
jgi:hypothetical protein